MANRYDGDENHVFAKILDINQFSKFTCFWLAFFYIASKINLHPVDLSEVLLRRPVGHDVHDGHELLEGDAAVSVGVVHVENSLLQDVKVLRRKTGLHDGAEIFLRDLAVGVLGNKVVKLLRANN